MDVKVKLWLYLIERYSFILDVIVVIEDLDFVIIKEIIDYVYRLCLVFKLIGDKLGVILIIVFY